MRTLLLTPDIISKFLELGIVGAICVVLFFILRWVFKTWDEKVTVLQNKLDDTKDCHKDELVDLLQQQFASNAAVIEKIQHISVTDKGALMNHITAENEKVRDKIDKLK